MGIFPTNSNHTIGSIARLLHDLEGEPKNSSRTLFSIERNQSTLTMALLNGAEACWDSLLPPPAEPLPAKPLPPILILQLDNVSRDNKNRYVFAFFSLLVSKGIFREVYINFLIVGHTHEDIDALFGRWSSRLKTNNYPTLPRLMKSFMDCETHPVIPHLIEEVPDFKQFVEGYLGTRGDELEGQSKAQQFKFFKDSSGWPLMEYKNLYTDPKWLPAHGNGIRLWCESEDGLPIVPSGSPLPLAPQLMKGLDDIKKGLNGYVGHWNTMLNDDYTGEFRQKNGPLQEYWKGVRIALDAPLQMHEALLDGFWLASRIAPDETDRMQKDGTLREEDAEDAPFVGRRRDRPRPSFRVNRDTHVGSFIVVRPADGDPKPFWLARAITAPSPDPWHMHMIKIQYWTPTSNRHINMETYAKWDTKEGNVWREDRIISSTWSSMDCIMTAWKPHFREAIKDPKVKIPSLQIEIIKASVAAFTTTANTEDSMAEE